MNTNSGEGTLDVGGVDGLFEDLEDESLEETPSDGDGTDDGGESTEPSLSDAVEDRTASAVFGQLQERVSETDDVDDVLADESPADIIASADEPEPEREPIGDELVDESALEELLLTDRTKSEEFLWVETDADEATGDDTSAVDDVADSSASPDTEGTTGSAGVDVTIDDGIGSEPGLDLESTEADDPEDGNPAETADTDDVDVEGTDTEPDPEPTTDPESEITNSAAPDRSEAELETTAGDDAPVAATDEADTAESAGETSTSELTDEVNASEPTDATFESTDEVNASEPTDATDDTLESDTESERTTKSADDDASPGLLGWLRSTLSRLFYSNN